jgi:hypothetical protein
MRAFSIFSFLFTFLLLQGCYKVNRDCSKFKTGVFEFEATSGTEMFTTRIERSDSLEIEYFKDQVDTASVRWINDCEYVLKKLNPKNRAEQEAIHIKILTTSDNAYQFEFNEVGKTTKSRASARKIADLPQ